MSASGWIFAALIVAVIAGSGVATVALRESAAQTQTSSMTVTIIMKGTVENAVSECAPLPQATTACPYFDLTVLRATDGYTYSLRGLATGTSWYGQCVEVSGAVSVPSTTGLGFVHGDIVVSSVAQAASC